MQSNTLYLARQRYELRDYQKALITAIMGEWRNGNRSVLSQLPTGGGKTVLFADIARRCTAQGKSVLVVAHREELLLQAQEKLAAIADCSTGLIKAGYKPTPALIQVGSIQSLCRRELPPARLIIIDEAHHSCASTYTSLINHYKEQECYILGVTATPARTDGQGFRGLFDSLVLGPSTAELISDGYLCPYKLFAAPSAIDLSEVRSTGGDYNLEDLAKTVNTTLLLGDILTTWQKHASGKKTVVFAVDVAHSKAIAAQYIQAGIPAEHLDGATPSDERAAILDRFRKGSTLVLANCGIVSEGFDLPDIEAIQCVRPTQSLILWLQFLGRALRPAPGKQHAIIIDHTQNYVIHGLPSDHRDWSLDAAPIRDNGRWIVVCPKCDHIFRPLSHERAAGATDCPNCGERIALETSEEETTGYKQREIQTDYRAAIEEIDLDIHPDLLFELDRLRKIQVERGYKPLWIYRAIKASFARLSYGDLRKIGEVLGYKPGWAWHQWRLSNQEKAA